MALEQSGVELVVEGLEEFLSGMQEAEGTTTSLADIASNIGAAGFEALGSAMTAVADIAVSVLSAAFEATKDFVADGITSFISYETKMNEVFTLLPGISASAMDAMSNQVKDFAVDFAVLPEKVVPALYQSLSAGIPSNNVFEFLEVAQMAAVGGVTDLTVAVNGISSVINAYGHDVLSATEASDLMFTAVRLGKTNFDELSASLFQVTPTTAALGVGFDEVTAALAAMTLQGVPTSVATTQLRGLFVELSKAGGDTAETFETLSGKSFRDFVAAGGTTQEALQMLEREAQRTGVGINDLFGSVEAGGAALALTGGGTEAFTSALAGMNDAAGATEGAYDTMQESLGRSLDKIGAQFEVLKLGVGEALAPIVGMFADVIEQVMPIAQDLADVFSVVFADILSGDIGLGVDDLREGLMGMVPPEVIEFLAGLLLNLQTFVGFVQANIPLMGETFDSVFGSVMQIGSDLGALWTNTLGPALADIFEIILGEGPTAQEVFTSALNAISAGAQAVAAWIRDPLIPAIEQVTAFIIANLPTWKAQAEQVFAAIGAAITWFNENVVPVLIEKFNEISAWVTENWPTIQANIETAINAISEVVTRVMDALAVFWTEHGEAVMTTIDGFWELLKRAFELAMDAVVFVIESNLDGIKVFWETWGDSIEAATQLILDGIGLVFDGWAAIFTTDWTEFGNDLKEAWDAAWALIKLALTDAIEDFQAIDWGAVGNSIMRAIADGIANGASLIRDAAVAAAQAAFDAAKEFLGIHSPSALFRNEIAGNIIDGWVTGINEGAKDVADAMHELSTGAAIDPLSLEIDKGKFGAKGTRPIDRIQRIAELVVDKMTVSALQVTGLAMPQLTTSAPAMHAGYQGGPSGGLTTTNYTVNQSNHYARYSDPATVYDDTKLAFAFL